MEHRRAHADQRRGEQDHGIGVGARHQQQADQGEAHADHEGIGLGLLVGVEPDQRLQHRCGALEGERDQADLAEAQRVVLLEDGIERRHQRLHHVVEQVAEAQREDDREGRVVGRGRRCRGNCRRRRGRRSRRQGTIAHICTIADEVCGTTAAAASQRCSGPSMEPSVQSWCYLPSDGSRPTHPRHIHRCASPARPAAVEQIPSAGGRGARHHLDSRRPRSHPGRIGGGGAADQPAPAAHRRAGRPDRQRLSRRRRAGLVVLRPSHRSAGPQEAVQRHARCLSGGDRAHCLLVGLLELPLLPLPHRRGHRRRVLGHQLGDPGTDPGAPARPRRPRHQRQLLDRRGGRRAALGVAARSRLCSAPTWAGGSPSAAAPCSAW